MVVTDDTILETMEDKVTTSGSGVKPFPEESVLLSGGGVGSGVLVHV